MSMKKRTVKLILECECGSSFQQECVGRLLGELAQAVKWSHESRHKGNKVTVLMDGYVPELSTPQ